MALTDREIVKQRAAGQANTFGLAGSAVAITSAIHQEVFDFEVPADASIAETGQRMPFACRVIAVHFTPATLLAASGSAYISQVIKKRDGAGGAAVSCATLDTNTAGQNVSLAAFVPAAFVLTATAADLVFAAGNVMTFASTETSTPATPIGKVTVVVEWI